MQSVSAQFTTDTKAVVRGLKYGALIGWSRAEDATADFFTVADDSTASLIGGSDIIKSSGGTIAFFDRFQYVEETARLMSMSTDQQLGQYPWGVMRGMADVVLDNTNKRYIAGYDPTIGDFIKPNRPLKLSIGFGLEHIPQFVGFSDMPENDRDSNKTTIHAYDAIEYLNGIKSELPIQTDIAANDLIALLLDEAGFSATQYSLEASVQGNIGVISLNGEIIGNVIKDIVEAEGGLFFVDENGIIRFWNRQHLVTNDTSRWTFTKDNIVKITDETTPIINDVKVVAKPREVFPNQKVWEQTSSLLIPPGQDLEIFANFNDEDGEMPVTDVDALAYFTSATTSRYSTNDQEDGSGSTLDSFITVTEETSFDTTYKMVFHNSYTSSIYITNIELWGTPAKVVQRIEEERSDDASIEGYGRNPTGSGEQITIENNLIQTADDALALAFALVETYKEPLVRSNLQVFGVPQLQFGDMITVHDPDTDEMIDYWITGMKKMISGFGKFVHQLVVEQRIPVDYFTVNESAIEGPDILAP